jgi:general secretion pathway protein G
MNNHLQTARASILVMGVVIIVMAFGFCLTHEIVPSGIASTAEHIKVTVDIEVLRTGLASYKSITGSFPTTEQGLPALVAEPALPPFSSEWVRLLSAVPKDPWGSDYIYFCPGRKHPDKYDLYSAGPDRLPNTADDDWSEGKEVRIGE